MVLQAPAVRGGAMSKGKTKRSIVLTAVDGSIIRELELARAAAVNLSGGKEFIYLENNGRGWSLTYTSGVVPDITKLGAMVMVRENAP